MFSTQFNDLTYEIFHIFAQIFSVICCRFVVGMWKRNNKKKEHNVYNWGYDVCMQLQFSLCLFILQEPRNLYVPPNKRTEIPVLKDSTPQCIQQTEDWEEEANPFPQTFAINLHPPSKLIMKGKHNTGMEAKHNTGVVVKQCATMDVKLKCQGKKP